MDDLGVPPWIGNLCIRDTQVYVYVYTDIFIQVTLRGSLLTYGKQLQAVFFFISLLQYCVLIPIFCFNLLFQCIPSIWNLIIDLLKITFRTLKIILNHLKSQNNIKYHGNNIEIRII